MGDLEDNRCQPEAPARFSLPRWLHPRHNRRATASTLAGDQAHDPPGLPLVNSFSGFATVQEESFRSPSNRPGQSTSYGSLAGVDSNGSSGSEPPSPNNHASSHGPFNLSRKAKIPSSSAAVLGGQAVELLPRNSAAEGGSIASTTDHSHRHAKQDATRLRTDSTASSSKSKQPAVQATRALGDVVIGRPSAAVKVSEVAAKKYMHMAEEEIVQEVAEHKSMLAKGTIHPLDRRYRLWWYFTVVAAAITGWLAPFRLAYLEVGYHGAQNQGTTGLEIALSCVFSVDIIISFFVGYYDRQGLLVMGNKEVALHYIRHRLLLDIITTLPFDAIAIAASGTDHTSTEGRYIALLGLLKLGRMYRVAVMFNNMSYNLNLSLMVLTLTRNLTLSFFLLHWAACGFWYIAMQEGAHEMTWVGQEQDILSGKTVIEVYVFSFYWAIVTFATLGYGDVTPSTTAEIAYTIIYVAINVVAWAYILGTITLLVTKQDEETGRYRARMVALNTYCNANNLSPDLKHTMAGLLRLHMSLSNEALGDEQVLAVYPTTIRRKILRQLYAAPLKECYLFQKCGMKFLDALMLGARVELFLPKVEIVSSLDHVNELCIVMAGYVELVPPKTGDASQNGAGGGGTGEAVSSDGGRGQPRNLQSHIITTDSHMSNKPGSFGSALGWTPSGSKRPPSPLHSESGSRWMPASGVAHAAAVRQISAGSVIGAAPMLGQRSVDLATNSAHSTGQQQQRTGQRWLRYIPGQRHLNRAWHWLTDAKVGSFSRGQAQLQEERQALAHVSNMALARASKAFGPGPLASGALSSPASFNAQMPAAAMRQLDTRSRMPLTASAAAAVGAATASAAAAGGPSSPRGSTGDGQDGFEGDMPEPPNPILGPGDCFAEVAYFTEVPKAEAVRTLTVCRVLVIPRSTYNAVARDFPLSSRQVLENLKNRAAELVAQFLPPDIARELLSQADLSSPGATAAAREDQLYIHGLHHQHEHRPQQQQQQPQPQHGATSPSAAAGSAGDAVSPTASPRAPAAAAARAASTPLPSTTEYGSSSSYPPTGPSQQQQQQSGMPAVDSAPGEFSGASRALGKPVTSLRSNSDTTAAAPSAAAGGVQLRPTGSGRDRSRPLLSSMSVQLSSRYYPGPASKLLYEFKDPAAAAGAGDRNQLVGSPRGAASDAALLEGSRQARALTRFTAAMNKQQHAALEASSEPNPHSITTTSTSSSVEGAAALWEGGSEGPGGAPSGSGRRALHGYVSDAGGSQGGRGPGGFSRRPPAKQGGPRLLSSMSLIPYRELAAVTEGMAHTPAPVADPRHAASASAFGTSAAGGSGGGSGGGFPAAHTQHTLQPLKTGGSKRVYSDEQLQAAAGNLTVQQQRLLADLLKLRQLVNKAAARFDQQRLTAFLDAAAAGAVEVVQDMLRQGMSVNTADYDGRTALMIAAYKGHKDVVLNLLFVGADTTLKDARGFDVMIDAARGGHGDVIDVLTRSGAKTGISSVLQAQLLCKATYEGKLDRLTNLIKAGCQPDAHDYDGQTALHVAAADGNLPAARVLVSAGAAVTLKDRWGYSPLDMAHKVGAAPLVEYFEGVVPAEAAAAAAENWKREQTEAALAAVRYGDAAALARLLQRGCPVDAADYDGRTLLHVAVTNKQQEIVSQLLAAGANPNATNSAGSSPLLEACMNGSKDIQSMLMPAGARLNLPSTEEAALLSSVLHMARHDQLLALLTAGANPAAADYDSRTPLHIAASVGDVEALRLLADAVADSSIERLQEVNWAAKDRWGDTPLQEASRAGHTEAAEFLRHMESQQQQQQRHSTARTTSMPLPGAAAVQLGAAAAAAAASSGQPMRQQQTAPRSWHSVQHHGAQAEDLTTQQAEAQQQQQQVQGEGADSTSRNV